MQAGRQAGRLQTGSRSHTALCVPVNGLVGKNAYTLYAAQAACEGKGLSAVKCPRSHMRNATSPCVVTQPVGLPVALVTAWLQGSQLICVSE